MFRRKRTRQQIADCRLLQQFSCPVRDQHDRILPKLGQHLAAGTTGRTAVIGHHGDSIELALTFRYGLEDRRPLGAHGGGISRIFYVDAGKHFAGFRPQGCANWIFRVRRIGVTAGFICQVDQETAAFISQWEHFLYHLFPQQ